MKSSTEVTNPYVFEKVGAPERSRTPNPQIRSLVLYPIELRARAEKPTGVQGQIATPPGRCKQGGSKGGRETRFGPELPDSYCKILSRNGQPRATRFERYFNFRGICCKFAAHVPDDDGRFVAAGGPPE